MGKLRETKNYDEPPGKWVYVAFIIILLAFSGIWLWSHPAVISATGVATGLASNAGPLERVLIVPSSSAAASQARAELAGSIQHEFRDGSVSVEVPSGTALQRFGRIQPVAQLRIPQPRAEAASGKPGKACAPSAQIPWGVAKVGGGAGGSGINIAILDTGVAKHPDLRTVVCMDTTGRRIKSGCSDQNGHGTHVAGIVAANGALKGVAPDANVWAIKVCGAGGTCWADDVAEGIYYAVDNGANIISMSFGANADTALVRDAIAYGAQHGVLFVAAAGNDGPDEGSIDWPAASAKVIAVGALDSGDAVASWSSRGINYQTLAWSVEEKDIELAAPGVGVESTWNDGCYRTLSGTSMAAPHIAGLAAKLWQGSAAATRDYLRYIARYYYADIGRAGDDPDAGFGLPVATA